MLEKWSAFWESVSLVIFRFSYRFTSVCNALKLVDTGKLVYSGYIVSR